MRAAILLAAGASRRFGTANKLLARYRGETILVRSLRIASAAPAGRLIVVVGAQAPRIVRVVRAHRVPRVTLVRAAGHRDGIGASLRAGLAALRPAERLLFLYLADMPEVPPLLARRLLHRLRATDSAIRPVHRGVPGHPVLLRRTSPRAVAALGGDRGLAPLLGAARRLPAARGAVRDIDRRTDGAARR